jgi:hypothetical protein
LSALVERALRADLTAANGPDQPPSRSRKALRLKEHEGLDDHDGRKERDDDGA